MANLSQCLCGRACFSSSPLVLRSSNRDSNVRLLQGAVPFRRQRPLRPICTTNWWQEDGSSPSKSSKQVMFLWFFAFWFVGSWIIPFAAHTVGFSKDTLTYRGQALYSLVTDIAEGMVGLAILYRCLARFHPLPNDWFRISWKGNWHIDACLGCLMFPLVTLVGHSMAGLSLSYAMELYSHKVSKAIFLAAFTPRNNQSFLGSAFPEVFPRLVSNGVASLKYGKGASEQPTSVSINLEYVKPYFYNQSPEEDVMLAKSLLTPTPYAVALETLTLSEEKYGKVRRFFIMTMKDNLFLPQHQEYTIAQNPPERVFRMDASDHSAFLSYPLQLCNLLIHIATL